MAGSGLVHGAWSGAHGFRHVRRGRKRRPCAFTPSLTGLGERAHLHQPAGQPGPTCATSSTTCLRGPRRDRAARLLLRRMVVTGASHTSPSGCATSSTSTPSCPATATAAWSLGGPPPIRSASAATGWCPRSSGVRRPAEAAFMQPRRIAHPSGASPSRCASPAARGVPVRPDLHPGHGRRLRRAGHGGLRRCRRRARSSTRWQYHEIATNHMVPSNRPDELAICSSPSTRTRADDVATGEKEWI